MITLTEFELGMIVGIFLNVTFNLLSILLFSIIDYYKENKGDGQ